MERRHAHGFTLIELMLVVAIIAIVAALATPYLLSAKASSNEASAIGSLRAVNSAQANYATTCASGHYSMQIADLVTSGYLSPDMGFNPKAGYNFAILPGATAQPGPADCAGDIPQSAYYSSGVPMAPTSGTRGFASSAAGTIWQDASGAAPTEPFVTAGTVMPIQ